MSNEALEYELLQSIQVCPWGELAFRRRVSDADREAIVFPHLRLTYSELAERVMRRARSLVGLGVKPGAHVGVLMRNSIEFIEVTFAISAIGAVVVPVNTRYRAYEMTYVIEHADVDVLIMAGEVAEGVDFVARLVEAFPELKNAKASGGLRLEAAPRLRHIVVFGAGAPGALTEAQFDRLAENVPESAVHQRRVGVRVRDPAFMLYTSGTTAMPKGGLLSHEAVLRTAQATAMRMGVTDQDRFWGPLPLFHLASLKVMTLTIWAGGCFISAPHFEAGDGVDTLEREKVTLAYPAFPAIVNAILYHPGVEKRDLSRLRAAVACAAIAAEPVQQRMRELLPQTVQIGEYGMTECCGSGTGTAIYDRPDAGFQSLGRPYPGVGIRVIDANGKECAPGEVGEILINGIGIFEGYYKNPEATAATFDGSWLRSGDLGSFNEEGELMFRGRLKDMLKVGGENVAAAEIETYIQSHPAVRLCQVVGVYDERLTEVPAAFVEFEDGQSASEQEIIEFCRGKISSFKVPRHVRVVQEWPLTASAKIQKVKLAKAFEVERGSS